MVVMVVVVFSAIRVIVTMVVTSMIMRVLVCVLTCSMVARKGERVLVLPGRRTPPSLCQDRSFRIRSRGTCSVIIVAVILLEWASACEILYEGNFLA